MSDQNWAAYDPIFWAHHTNIDRLWSLWQLNNQVTFRRATEEDPTAERFLREWLQDIAAIEDAADDASVLHFPPPFSDR